MKKGLFAVAVLLALGVMAQQGRNTGTETPTKVIDPTKVKRKVTTDRELTVTDDIKSNNASPKATTQGNAEVAAMPDKSGREIGMERAEEVRNSHAAAATEAEATEMIGAINADTKSKLEDIDSKLEGAEIRLLEKKASGKISADEFELKKAQLDMLKARSEAIGGKVK